jgi:thiamine transport system ATP-binding protein
MTDGDPGVAIEGMSATFDGVTALEDVSLTIDEGEFFTLVGPSGCGKTTMLRTIAGLTDGTDGSVAIGGRDVTDSQPEERNVGMVFQNYALFPHMSVRENVAYGLRFHDHSRGKEDRVAELLDLVDLTGAADRSPEQLSGGQQQRIALARALAPEPDVLLLDEPLSALDAKLRKRLRVQIQTIQRELDITTVYVTHDQAEALALSDRVAVMQNGRIEQVAAPETVYRDPASRFVAAFVGDNNLFDGVVGDDGSSVAVAGVELPLPAGAEAAAGESVTMAVRPEAITLGDGAERAQSADAALTATIETVEFLGDAYRVHCRWQDRQIECKTTAVASPTGEVTLRFDAADAQIV